MTKLQNSIAHRKSTRATTNKALSMIELLEARKMALDLANELGGTSGSTIRYADYLYDRAKKESQCR